MQRNTGLFVLALVFGAAMLAAFERPRPAQTIESRHSAVSVAPWQGATGGEVPIDTVAGARTSGLATFYADEFDGRLMASGKRFDMTDPNVAASNRWPLGTRLLVRRLPNSPWDAQLAPDDLAAFRARSIVVTVEDRGAFQHELDLSASAFAQLAYPDEGVIHVQVELLD